MKRHDVEIERVLFLKAFCESETTWFSGCYEIFMIASRNIVHYRM